ncbi:phage/plasmid primase, P4 family [Actinomadura rugatobispora]|uniref:Phage/plasmid primase, P4 family n=1 Tax=Actinomadura rugatobispora TaxID=1994 RepID=A0ABW0ZNJ6_9ACTN
MTDQPAPRTEALLNAAQALAAAGCSTVPARTDGSKAPAAFWKTYQTQRADPDQLNRWFTTGAFDGLGIITGQISAPGGAYLEMLELEGRAVHEHLIETYAQALTDHGQEELWTRITGGYLETTPSGGLHILYRVTADQPRGNTKLARRPSTSDELTAWKTTQQAGIDTEPDPQIRARRQAALDNITRGEQVPQVLIETRGEGGFVIVAPSGGHTHPSGQPWVLLVGGPATIATITEEERDTLHALATLLDTLPAPEPPAAPQRSPTGPRDADEDRLRPGDDFNAKATWSEILEPHGWRRTRSYGDATGWCRPGKSGPHVSATTGRSGTDNLYVFSSSTIFDTEEPYSKFAAYALLEHAGDYAAAARALAAQGYGDPLPHGDEDLHELIADYQPQINGPFTPANPRPSIEGNLATVHELHPGARPDTAHLATTGTTYRYSDDRLALTLVAQFGDRIRYCPDRGNWLAWNGTRWNWCERGGGPVREYAKQVGRSLPEDARPDISFKQRALSAAGVTAALALAQTDPHIVVGMNDIDSHPWELNTPGGIVDLRTGKLGPPDPERLHTRITLCTPDPAADPSAWHTFLHVTFGGDDTLTTYLQRLMGYSATGYIGPHVLPFSWGSGGNGKGVFLETSQHILGDYATTAPVGFLMASQFQGHETEIARLAGARMVLCSEVNEDDRFDEAKVKQLTGGDTLTARFMRQDHFTFEPTHHLWLMGNHQPSVQSGGRAFWRRLRLIPFTHEVPDDQIIDDLQGILTRDHGPAILNWIVQGAAMFADQGLKPEPESVTAATENYKKEQDTVARFVEECCRVGGGEQVQIKVAIVRDAYERWCTAVGEKPVSAKKLTQELSKHGAGRGRGPGGGARVYSNLTVMSVEGDDEGGDGARSDEGWFR